LITKNTLALLSAKPPLPATVPALVHCYESRIEDAAKCKKQIPQKECGYWSPGVLSDQKKNYSLN
jgi:hypothetical protein